MMVLKIVMPPTLFWSPTEANRAVLYLAPSFQHPDYCYVYLDKRMHIHFRTDGKLDLYLLRVNTV